MLNWRGVASCKTGRFGIGSKMVASDHSFTRLHCLVYVDNLVVIKRVISPAHCCRDAETYR